MNLKIAIIIAISLSIISCAKTEIVPDIYPDPMVSVFKKNNIKSYIRTVKLNGEIVHIDSIKLNSEGRRISKIRLLGSWDDEWFVYDSIGRVIEYHIRTDVDEHVRDITYKIDIKANEVIQNLNDGQCRRFRFDKSFKFLKENVLYKKDKTGDTISRTYYSYRNGKIKQIETFDLLDGLFSYRKTFEYENNKLHKIYEKFETQYISPKNGLIDSGYIATFNQKVEYKYN